ncbi:MAG: hypothetical protein WHS44_11275 [Fimbriimonadales bacterium]|nr:MAG: hypothetical protein KatS3mg018_0107 [Fimbriimonadales bacterium]
MPIIETVEQLADFLERNEEWRRKLFAILVPRELARLPEEFDAFRQEVRRDIQQIHARLDRIERAMDERFARVDREFEAVRQEMREGFARVDREFEAVRQEMREGFEQLRAEMREGDARLERKIQRNTDDIAELKGISLERAYRDKARSLFGRYFRDVRVIDWVDVEEQLEAIALLSAQERAELSVVDILARGRRRSDGREAILVIEVSWGIAPSDVARAVQRAAILTRRGVLAVPIAAGRELSDEARQAASEQDCVVVLDGRFEVEQPLRE